MASFSTLDEQLNALNALHIGSAKMLDNFADTSKAIADRARRITTDVQPWEMAQENIAATIEEMSRAARCYHPPVALRLVLARKEKSPEALCKCIDYLVFTDSYLVSHPPNVYADQIASSVTVQLAEVVKVAEDVVKEAFITSLQKKQAERPGESERKDTAALRLIHDPVALQGIEQVVHRLGENFNRTEVVFIDVKQLIEEHVLRLVDSQFDNSYKEEEMRPCQNHTTRRGIAPIRKHYQKGGHRLLDISAKSRQLVSEAADCLKRYALDPLDDSFDVVEMPGELATLVFERVKAKCFAAVQVDQATFLDPTRIFVLSRGEGTGLWGETRHFRDVIFIGLDLLEELWKWKVVAESLPGDNHAFVDHVDAGVEQFLFEVRDLLDCYVTCKGALDAGLLREYSRSLHRTEWFPALDSSAHVSVTNQVYLHKVMLTSYYGATKLALHGSLLSVAAEAAALQEVEDYMMRCVLGTLRDLEVIAEVALEMRVGSGEEQSHHHHFPSISGARHTTEGDHHFSPAVFMLNSVLFFMESYRKEACFHQRRLPMQGSEEGKKSLSKESSSVPIVSNILAVLEDEVRRWVEEFATSWSGCFPRISSNPRLESIDATDGELHKSQRMAVKHWYRDVSESLTRKINACRTFAVLDTTLRNALIESSVEVVRDGFNTMEVKLRERTWSSRPMKWMVRGVDEWTDLLCKVL
ncbi:hypothetical protein DQ04_00251090 [Trypanosoma grayi]|uniref:hypothetical protein n=1 Tax=Trypanosoma grayi TaxID=71804 RepID=UPI0004F411F0|nr:hypothetical protein DQ04_00251090 [Trypanosoma grayi]KEG14933.1 hypothetical protein DQ04_00251090 [Trypanosoma grayi]